MKLDFRKYQIKLMMMYYNHLVANGDERSCNDILIEWIDLYSKKIRNHWNMRNHITNFYD